MGSRSPSSSPLPGSASFPWMPCCIDWTTLSTSSPRVHEIARDRQQTLRATIDWSHSLLTASEKRLFRRMGVFRGGCSLESIEAACSEDVVSVLDDLGSLVDQGLIQVAGPADRFQMLQTIREYALEELQTAAEAELIGRRHAAHLADVAADIGRGIEGTDQVRSIERGVLEDADLRAGLDFLLSRTRGGDTESAELGMQICGDLWLFWHIRAKHLKRAGVCARVP